MPLNPLCNQRVEYEYVDEENWYTGEIEQVRKEVFKSNCDFHDTSLHSYGCRYCGQKFYYSAVGKAAEEKGVDIYDLSDAEWKKARGEL